MTIEEFKNKTQKKLDAGITAVYKVKKGIPVKGILTELRKMFPNNYVDKDTTFGGDTVYTIFAGDKEFHKFLCQPLRPKKSIKQQLLEELGMK